MKIAARTYFFPNPPAPRRSSRRWCAAPYDEATDKAAGRGARANGARWAAREAVPRTPTSWRPYCRVAEYGDVREIVGVIRGCIKTVTSGKRSSSTQLPVYVKFAYILGLRVSATHRRLGIATKLVQELEGWCRQNGAEYAYMATECSNKPSLNLFTQKCNYVKFRNPTVLVQPVHLHSKPLASDIMIVQVPPQQVELVYRRVFSSSEFFPKDIDRLLSNKLNLGTFVALPKKSVSKWNPKAGRTRVLDAMVPWLKIPSVPNVFKNFGFYFMYGLHMEGKDGPRLMKNLCKFVHNTARNDPDCRVVVAEVGQTDPVREAIPHWKKFSWDEDIWCIKKLGRVNQNHYDWHKSSSVIFVDPRDL
ncbi:UNVERIFIED_CONTAM: putative N-acetyltransferase HLS1 [Sesamum angustifolium]|uniref:N-acetyltransferase HLS1 n=1 Tax=Sesamum angustifolium TaxID=2727405 RepID=A0AAW2LJF4_9LAMI